MVKFICMNLSEYKLSSNKLEILYGQHQCPFGKCLIGITSKEQAVCHLRFIDKTNSARCVEELKSEWPGTKFQQNIEKTEIILEKVFSLKNHDDISVFLKGTDFQIKVWKALTEIPRGKTVNYSYIADLISNPKAVRAIAKVVGSNPVAYIIPCHRVISKSAPSKTCWRTNMRAPILKMVVQVVTMSNTEYNVAVNTSEFIINYGIHPTPFGKCLIGITNNQNAICHLWFCNSDSADDSFEIMTREWPDAEYTENPIVTHNIIQTIFSNDMDYNKLVILLKGTEFQINVWKSLLGIPRGDTVTYSYIAESIGNPKAVRAVATTLAKNRIGYLVPCHRVLSKRGSTSKFRWGNDRRWAMLKFDEKT